MSPLQGFQKRFLRSRANNLKPVVFIGKNGLNPEVLDAIDEALTSRELIKVKFVDYKEERKELAAEIEQQCHCQLAGMIGHNAILYRQNAEPDKQKIKLPVRE